MRRMKLADSTAWRIPFAALLLDGQLAEHRAPGL